MNDIRSIKLRIASPDVIRKWSSGEVTKQETINYRTQKPEENGLFCERIFGPIKDWECACGKYKKIRYKGVICDKCGVEVTRSIVRRSRMGHINLVTPVAHTWFMRGLPSKIGLILDISIQSLEKVIYFSIFIITHVNEELKEEITEQVREEYKKKRQIIENNFKNAVIDTPEYEKRTVELNKLEDLYNTTQQELKMIAFLNCISDAQYKELSLKYGHIFEAGIGAEAVYNLLENINVKKTLKQLQSELENTVAPNRKERLLKRIKLLKSFEINDMRPEWMILKVVPIIPPDLRPMVPLEGGRFATSDLNDLYRLVINRNNRLKQLMALNAPEIICRNEKRMLQEAIDALIDNSGRGGKAKVAVTGQKKRPLKSLADTLKGKSGRFRQNLLGKRVDYSGRSVIVVGPTLKLDQCGLPISMALELFRPFILVKLIGLGLAHNIRSANRFIELESSRKKIVEILQEIITVMPVLLNRAPTLHRLGIQAFKPVLINGKAIQVHPLVCAGFNADFDGDQMAVHVPLTEEAISEAYNIMLSTNNFLKPANGDPIITPTKDIVWGAYYLTYVAPEQSGSKKIGFANINDAKLAYDLDKIKIHDLIHVRLEDGTVIDTTIGRIIFNSILPVGYPYINKIVRKGDISQIIQKCLKQYDRDTNTKFLDNLKATTFKFLTISGLSLGMDDMPMVHDKDKLIRSGTQAVADIDQQYNNGLLTKDERHEQIVQTWTNIKDQISELSRQSVSEGGTIFGMIDSGARGSWAQLTQIIGMKGLVNNPSGNIIELPIRGNFKDGFDVLEYFISTHGARKGLSDMALKTSNAGYLTRRLVDVAQDIVVNIEDCGDTDGVVYSSKELSVDLIDVLVGRYTLESIRNSETPEILIKKGVYVSTELAETLKSVKLNTIKIRSVLTCKAVKGICQKCYGMNLGDSQLVELGTAAGIIAAQSIGEPGTQLTMRTFHTGGVVELDITQGLPRVEELLEVRIPKNKAIISEVNGKASITVYDPGIQSNINTPKIYEGLVRRHKIITITPAGDNQPETDIVGTKSSKKKTSKSKINASNLTYKEYIVPVGRNILIKDGDSVVKGDALTDGSLDLLEIYNYKGREFTQKYILNSIMNIYVLHGQKVNIKHLEVIVRQMFSKVLVQETGDTDVLSGEVLDKGRWNDIQMDAEKKGGDKGIAKELLLSITKAALSTYTFLSAASFQETSRSLINAAITNRVDLLEGLKENVIIGRLIPAGTGFRKKVLEE